MVVVFQFSPYSHLGKIMRYDYIQVLLLTKKTQDDINIKTVPSPYPKAPTKRSCDRATLEFSSTLGYYKILILRNSLLLGSSEMPNQSNPSRYRIQKAVFFLKKNIILIQTMRVIIRLRFKKEAMCVHDSE